MCFGSGHGTDLNDLRSFLVWLWHWLNKEEMVTDVTIPYPNCFQDFSSWSLHPSNIASWWSSPQALADNAIFCASSILWCSMASSDCSMITSLLSCWNFLTWTESRLIIFCRMQSWTWTTWIPVPYRNLWYISIKPIRTMWWPAMGIRLCRKVLVVKELQSIMSARDNKFNITKRLKPNILRRAGRRVLFVAKNGLFSCYSCLSGTTLIGMLFIYDWKSCKLPRATMIYWCWID